MSDLYIAVTIGPIYDLMSFVTKPAALWAVSYMFSDIAKSLCCKIIEDKLCDVQDIVVPFFPEKQDKGNYKKLLERNDGVGLFHDHIIFRAPLLDKEQALKKFEKIKNDVLGEAASRFGISDEDYFKQYIMVSVCADEVPADENPIMHFSRMLDSMELQKLFPVTEKSNPILDAFSNEKVRKFGSGDGSKGLSLKYSDWTLIHKGKIQADKNDPDDAVVIVDGTRYKKNPKDEKAQEGYIVRDLPDIAAACEKPELKKSNYYGFLRMDGDNMGELISSLGKESDKDTTSIADACHQFSEICLDYSERVAEHVKNFGGVTIFSGGDDLVALVPCEYKGKTVFSLIQDIQETFETCFKVYIKVKNGEKTPSLSTGLLISYKKFPLYEAEETSLGLLFDMAKKQGGKNCVAVRLQKHSGQSTELVINNSQLKTFIDQLDAVLNCGSDDEVLLSAAQKLALFQELIKNTPPGQISFVFKNLFDADFHQGAVSNYLHNKLPIFYEQAFLSREIRYVEKDNLKSDDPGAALGKALRLMKFFVEKGDD